MLANTLFLFKPTFKNSRTFYITKTSMMICTINVVDEGWKSEFSVLSIRFQIFHISHRSEVKRMMKEVQFQIHLQFDEWWRDWMCMMSISEKTDRIPKFEDENQFYFISQSSVEMRHKLERLISWNHRRDVR